MKGLVVWLNGGRDRMRTKAGKVLEDLNSLRRGLNPTASAGIARQIALPQGAKIDEKFGKVYSEPEAGVWGMKLLWLNRQLRKCRVTPQLELPLEDGWFASWQSKTTLSEALYRVVRLAEHGQLWRIRRCQSCKRWFQARARNQTFCSTRCAQAHWRTSEKGRKSRSRYMRIYMRKYRRDNL